MDKWFRQKAARTAAGRENKTVIISRILEWPFMNELEIESETSERLLTTKRVGQRGCLCDNSIHVKEFVGRITAGGEFIPHLGTGWEVPKLP